MSDQKSATGPSNRLAQLTQRIGTSEPAYQLVERSPLGVLLVNSDHVIEYLNPAACDIVDGEFSLVAGKHLSQLLGADYRSVMSDPASLAHPLSPRASSSLRSNGHGDLLVGLFNRSAFEFQIRTLADMVRVVEVVEGGRVGKFSLWYLRDITARKQLEMELHYRDTFFHNLIDSSVDGIIASDMKGRIILFNSGAQRILGYTREEAFRSLHVSQIYPEGEARDILKRMRSEKFGGRGKLLRHEVIAITRDGRQIPMSLSGGIIYDGEKEMATYGIFTDLRAMREVEGKFQQTHEMLLQSEKMAGLGRLAAGVAHEINNPMSGIMLYANLVRESLGPDHSASADMDVIVHEAERCKQIVSDLLEFSHQTHYEQTGVNVAEQVCKALALLQKQPLFHNIQVEVNIAQDLSRIAGNPIRLNQVFMNLIVNAAQAMQGHGKIVISGHHRSQGGIVEFSIKDDGPGIAKDDLPQIFDPFFTTKADSGGTGLGLSVSYAIVREHKGSIRVSSEFGRGTTFRLRFPVLRETPKEGE